MLISLLLALLIGLIGYAGLVAWNRTPAPGVAGSEPFEPRRFAAPERLPRRVETAEAAATTLPSITLARQVDVTIAVTGAPPQGGVLVCADDTGAPIAWMPMSAGTAVDRELRLRARVPSHALRVFAAADQERARSSYWSMTRVTDPLADGARIELDCTRHPVEVTARLTIEPALSAVPFAVRRRGDPAWRPDGATAGTFANDGRLLLALATGDYELVPLLGGSWQPAPLDVRGATTTTITFAPPARADRP